MTHFSDRPLAAEGLISYRYRTTFGWCMIGAENDKDALVQAARSVDGLTIYQNLQVWNGDKYIAVEAKNET